MFLIRKKAFAIWQEIYKNVKMKSKKASAKANLLQLKCEIDKEKASSVYR